MITLLSLIACNIVFPQNERFIGTYEEKVKHDTGEILEVVLEIKSNETFTCSFYQNQLCYQEDKKGQGKWTVKNEEIWFFADEGNDVNEEFSLNFNGTKAKLEGSRLIFYESKMIWPPRVTLTKIE